MLRQSSILPALAVGCALVLRPVAADAQDALNAAAPRFELTPLGGYQWGGSFDTDPFEDVPAGRIEEQGAFAWGVVLGWRAMANAAVELTYLRQDTDIRFNPDVGATRELSGFANNYIQLGGRWEFPVRIPVHPFLSASLGVNIVDRTAGLSTKTRFAWSLGGGARYMFGPAERVGLRADVKWWVTPVPSDDFFAVCDFFGCFVEEGTSWVNQGQATAGLVFAF